jgi:hypothetical protein
MTGQTDAVLRCPVHGIPDCSPLLNGCSIPNRIAAEVARRVDEALGEIERRIAVERDLARAAYKAARTDYFADDYSRWVGHAEAGTNAIADVRAYREEVRRGTD